MSNKEAVSWSMFWISLALCFAACIYMSQGVTKASEFLTAYVIEKALSVDNLFVFVLVFGYFQVPDEYQHKVLFWGVLGAIVMRAIFIFTGATLIGYTHFDLLGYEINYILLFFGIFLIYAGVKSATAGDDDEEQDFSQSPAAKLIRKIFKDNVKTEYHADKFIVKERELNDIHKGLRLKEEDRKKFLECDIYSKVVTYATPLLVVVAVIELTDLLFAVDSIPAIFAVSKDSFVLYASNIFAILGLRSLYFLLANFMHMFKYLKYGLAAILSFIGIKMVVAPVLHIDSVFSLLVVAGLLVVSTVASLMFKDKEATV